MTLVAYGDGTGTSTVAPTVSATGISAGSGGVYLIADPTASGAGTVAGTFSSSPISATGDGVELLSEGSATDLGAANITTTFTNEVVDSGDTGYYAEAYTYGNPAKVAPTVSGGSVTSPDDYAFDLESYVEGGSTNSAQTTPSISSNTSGSYSGIYLLSEQDSGSSTFGGVTVGGSISDSSVLAQYSNEAGVYAEAICYYACTGGANNNLSITGSSVADYYEYGVYLLSEADTGLTDTSPATVSGTISGTHSDSIDAYDSYGIYTEALDSDGSSSGGGTATDSAVISGIHAAGYSGDVYNVAESEYGSANGNSSVTGALLDNGWSAADIFGAEDYTESNMSATNSSAVASGSNGFSNNTVTGFTGTTSYGLNWQLYGSGGDHEIPAATISGNTLTNIDGNGIYAETDGNTSNGTSYVAPSIENNTLNGIGEDGIYLEDVDPSVVHNTVSNAGLEGTATKSTGTYTSQDGLYVLDAPTQGSVRCNTLSGSPVGIGYDTNVSDPLTNDNNFANASNVTNSPFNLMSNLPSPGVTNATSNWWGHYPVTQTDASVLNTSTGSINITPMLTSMSTCTS